MRRVGKGKPGKNSWLVVWRPVDGPARGAVAETRDGGVAYAGHLAYGGAASAVLVVDASKGWPVWAHPAKAARIREPLEEPWAGEVSRILRGAP